MNLDGAGNGILTRGKASAPELGGRNQCSGTAAGLFQVATLRFANAELVSTTDRRQLLTFLENKSVANA